MQSELVNWFGRDFQKIRIAFTSNLGTNAGVMAACGLGYPVSIEGLQDTGGRICWYNGLFTGDHRQHSDSLET